MTAQHTHRQVWSAKQFSLSGLSNSCFWGASLAWQSSMEVLFPSPLPRASCTVTSHHCDSPSTASPSKNETTSAALDHFREIIVLWGIQGLEGLYLVSQGQEGRTRTSIGDGIQATSCQVLVLSHRWTCRQVRGSAESISSGWWSQHLAQ